MEQIKIRVYAKVNLSLDIKGLFEDGYHILDMLNTSVDIYDVVTATKASKSEVYMDGILQDDSNTATRAVQLLEMAYGYPMKIEIEKGIPMKAGLGGSSADAAAAFYCYGQLYGIELEYMHKIALSIGSDVVYMMTGGAAIVKCRGEMVFPVEDIDLCMVVAQKCLGAETKDVYKQYDKTTNIDKTAVAITDKINAYNVLETPAEILTPNIVQAKYDLLKYTNRVFMTGSGSAYVGIFDSIEDAKKCELNLYNYLFKKAVVTRPAGVKLLEDM